ncbi:hypothetical protein ABG768_025686 [Culter alburnus]|uniref:Jacalin-type lectin domain-containing protein n=1 Tax=Culter alburnus TaxID=194366 RepID=A0AAW2AIM6_CULAL
MSYPTTVERIGGNGGGEFSFTGQNTGAKWQVKAVKVWLTDGRSETFGKPAGTHQEYRFLPGECFTSLPLWGNGAGTRLGAIKFKTTKLGFKKYPMDVGTGYCLGIAGRAGADIYCMGFMILNATSSWSVSASLTATFSMEVKAGIPLLREVTAGYSLSVGFESSYGQEHTVDSTKTVSTDVDVPPGKKVEVDTTIGKATFLPALHWHSEDHLCYSMKPKAHTVQRSHLH